MICGIVTIFDEQYMFRLDGSELRAEAIDNIGKGCVNCGVLYRKMR